MTTDPPDAPPQLSGVQALWCAWYLGGSQCTLPGRLLPHFPEDIRTAAFDPAATGTALAAFARTPADGESDTDRAVARLTRMEAARMAEVLENPANQEVIAAHSDVTARVDAACEATLGFLASYGMDVARPVVRIVDRFPEPYHERRGAMLVADAGDERKYGVSPGIYFARRAVRPFYSEALVCHELFHVALGARDPDRMGRGLEEGIAELLGSIMLAGRQVGPVPTFWIEAYNRNNHVFDPYWEQYNDYLRMAYLLYRRLGLDGLMGIVAGGRVRIKEFERDRAVGAPLPTPRHSSERFDAVTDDLAERIILGFPRLIAVSPVASLIAPHIQVGATVKEIAAATGFTEEPVRDALRELADTFKIIGMRADGLVVTSSDLDLYVKHGILRFTL